MMIKNTEKLETNIKSKLHEGTKWIQQNKNMYCKNISQKIAAVMIRTFTCDSPSTIIDNAPIQWAMQYAGHSTWFLH